MANLTISRPAADEYNPYYDRYVALLPGEDAMAVLVGQLEQTLPVLRGISEEKSMHRYAADKWSVKEVLNHLADTERIMAYRLLRVARGDKTPVEGFEQDDYVRNGGADRVPWQELVSEFAAVRRSTILMLRNLPPEAIDNVGMANKDAISVKALAWIIAGHLIHHMRLLREGYGV